MPALKLCLHNKQIKKQQQRRFLQTKHFIDKTNSTPDSIYFQKPQKLRLIEMSGRCISLKLEEIFSWNELEPHIHVRWLHTNKQTNNKQLKRNKNTYNQWNLATLAMKIEPLANPNLLLVPWKRNQVMERSQGPIINEFNTKQQIIFQNFKLKWDWRK